MDDIKAIWFELLLLAGVLVWAALMLLTNPYHL